MNEVNGEPEGPERNRLKWKSWSPYVVGAGIGILSILAFLIVDKPLGMSTEVSKISGWTAGAFVGMEAVLENSYWSSKTPAFGYSTVFLIFTFIGAGLSAWLGGDVRREIVPRLWNERFGGSPGRRLVAAFFGGAMLLYGARLAGGCTSGHGISGTLQLAASGWLFFVVVIATGVPTALLMFRKPKA